ncbi:MAG: 3'-5' exonuclease, partial [Rhodospirillales bacterium]
DSNIAQYLWLRLLARDNKNICCVGDDDQSIYSWRGAEIGNILRFEKDFPGALVVRLERNYRSTGHILAAASGLIAHNRGRLGKTLWTEGGEGAKVLVRGVWDSPGEARAVCDIIETLQARGDALNSMAVLVRTGAQTREFEERLIATYVPYRVIGGQRFYERLEIRDAVAYLRLINQPGDDLAFERLVNTPKRGLGKVSVEALRIRARLDGVSMTSAAGRMAEGGGLKTLKPRAGASLGALMADFERWRQMRQTMPPAQLANEVLDQSGYLAMWRDNKSPDAPGRVDNLKELIVALEDFDSLQGFLDHVSLVMDNEETQATDRVSLMTMHAAKGLEFDTVFLAGWEDGLFPHLRALDDDLSGGLEEERRLAYVGLTRARSRAIVSFAASRRIFGRWQSALPSSFINELPAENVEREIDPGLYGSGSRSGGTMGLREDIALFAKPAGGCGEARFEPGTRVFHQKFGYGRVISSDGGKLEIAFDKAGCKKVMDSYVKAA